MRSDGGDALPGSPFDIDVAVRHFWLLTCGLPFWLCPITNELFKRVLAGDDGDALPGSPFDIDVAVREPVTETRSPIPQVFLFNRRWGRQRRRRA